MSSRARLQVVTGKGGVGKSAVAAALAWRASLRGERTLVVEVDPRETLHELFGVPPCGGKRVEVRPGLALESLPPRAVIDREIAARVAVPFLARRILASPIYHHFVDGAPGLKELAVLEHLRRALTEGFELGVLDAPASGHILAQLEAPRLVAEAVPTGPLSEICSRLSSWLAQPGLLEIVLVTQPEEMPVEESLELVEKLEHQLALAPGLIFVNQVIPERQAAGTERCGAAGEIWRQRIALQAEQRQRLRSRFGAAARELEWLPLARGPRLVESLAALLDEAAPGEEHG